MRVHELGNDILYQQAYQGYIIRIYWGGYTIHKDNELVLEQERFVGSIVDKSDISAAKRAVERIAQALALKRRQTRTY